jgi:predicted P-loop ATPase
MSSPNNIIPIHRAEDQTEDQRQKALFAWADHVLYELGLVERVARASNVVELRKITFDANTAEVDLAIRDALHPASGAKTWFFEGLRAGALKRILKNRFDDMMADREAELRNQRGGQQSTPDWTDELRFDDMGNIRATLGNLILFLRHHPRWRDVLGFDEFAYRPVARKRLPWGEEAADWTDHHESQTRVWFQREVDINPGLGDVGRAVQAAARANPFHPVREYLDGLVWDGTPRLDTWLARYFHAEDSEYIRAIGPRWLISAVARVYEPGCKVDHVLVLEGPQGKQKSESLRTLAKDWFTDRLSHVASKDAAQEITGVWLVEIAEMDALTKASSSAMKAFITRRFDRFRPPWARHLIKLQRQCVFAGSINPPVGGYLKDPTGARRFWPVLCRGMIDRAGLERDRDQLWAEAVVRYRAGGKWWLETPELEALATAEQALRFKHDAWQEPIQRWLGRRNDVAIGEVLKGALKIKPREQSHSAVIRVSNILTVLGFEQYLARRGKKRHRRYRRNQP